MSDTDPDTIYCWQCGNEIRAGSTFCRKCGTKQPEATDGSDSDRSDGGVERADTSEKESDTASTQRTPDVTSAHRDNASDEEVSAASSVEDDSTSAENVFDAFTEDTETVFCHGCGSEWETSRRNFCGRCPTRLMTPATLEADNSAEVLTSCSGCSVEIPQPMEYCILCGERNTGKQTEIDSQTSNKTDDNSKPIGTQIEDVATRIEDGADRIGEGLVTIVNLLFGLFMLYAFVQLLLTGDLAWGIVVIIVAIINAMFRVLFYILKEL